MPNEIAPVVIEIAHGDVSLVGTDGIGDPLGNGEGGVGNLLRSVLGTPTPPTLVEFAHAVDFSREMFDDDRTLVTVWPRRRVGPRNRKSKSPHLRRRCVMARAAIERSRLGQLTKIGQGGQGVVYRAPKVTTKFSDSLVYKEYKAQARDEIDFGALAAMPDLVESWRMTMANDSSRWRRGHA